MLGHIFPGTETLAGPIGAPFRFLIHQTVGSEVSLFRVVGSLRIPSALDASIDYFDAAREHIPSSVAL